MGGEGGGSEDRAAQIAGEAGRSPPRFPEWPSTSQSSTTHGVLATVLRPDSEIDIFHLRSTDSPYHFATIPILSAPITRLTD